MRQKRAKAYKKQMATYERTFQFRSPYQVLITADFLTAARSFHLDPIAGLKRTLQGDLKCMISQCCIKSLYDADDQVEIRLAKTFERRRCGHVEQPETPDACVCQCVGGRNKNRYIVATQDLQLRKKLREVPGVPLIYINRSVMILEPPSPATLMMKRQKEHGNIGLSAEEAVTLGKRKRSTGTFAGQHDDDEAIASATANIQPQTRERDIQSDNEDNDEDEDNDDDEDDEDADDRNLAQQEGRPVQPKSSSASSLLVEKKKKKRRGPSEPNPLARKKPKIAPKQTNGAGNGKQLPLLDIASTIQHVVDGPRKTRKRRHKTKGITKPDEDVSNAEK